LRNGRLLLVTGARGAGKSTFCARLAELARLEGRTVAGVLSRAIVQGGRKTGIEVEDLCSGRRRLLATEAARHGSLSGLGWDFEPEVLIWGDTVLAASAPCDVLLVDELGVLEFERGQGWQAGFAAVDGGRYALAIVVVRPELLAQARSRWPQGEVLDFFAAGPRDGELDRLVSKILSDGSP
jgi:nucleoside-triphosphatase